MKYLCKTLLNEITTVFSLVPYFKHMKLFIKEKQLP